MADEEKRPELENKQEPSDPSSAETSHETPEPQDASSVVEASGSASDEAPESGAGSESDVTEAQVSPVPHDDEAHIDAHGGGHGGHGDDHFAHVLPMSLLIGVLLALVLLTVLTVGVTAVDLGSQGNFIVAMIIATVKAALVMGYFMHMVWDSKFNVVAFTSSFLFVLLFLGMLVLDRSEYGNDIDRFESQKKIEALQ